MRLEIRITGFGGQGIVLAGIIIGKAFALFENQQAVMTQAYGPEARGGASSANLVISDEAIDYPFVQEPDVLIAISQEAYTRFHREVKPGGTVLIDDELVNPFLYDKYYGIPATNLAEELGRRIVTNVVMVGFFTAVTRLVKLESVTSALQVSVKQKTIPLNMKALMTGYEYGLKQEVSEYLGVL
jgi:2-oxoglutarate ferredoxin oxidoreductase subunit gamma